jgi:hypothetical protein
MANPGPSQGTSVLIERLSADARPVRRLAHPGWRALLWLAAAAALIAVCTLCEGVRQDLADCLRRPGFMLGRCAAVLTAITAALATFELSLPDRSARWLWLPLPFAALWIGNLGFGCLTDWLARGADGFVLDHSGACFRAILGTSLPLGALLFLMVRHAGFVRPIATALAGGLALAAAAEAGLTLYHEPDAGVMDLLIHLAAVTVVVGLAAGGARPIFRLLAPRVGVAGRLR